MQLSPSAPTSSGVEPAHVVDPAATIVPVQSNAHEVARSQFQLTDEVAPQPLNDAVQAGGRQVAVAVVLPVPPGPLAVIEHVSPARPTATGEVPAHATLPPADTEPLQVNAHVLASVQLQVMVDVSPHPENAAVQTGVFAVVPHEALAFAELVPPGPVAWITQDSPAASIVNGAVPAHATGPLALAEPVHTYVHEVAFAHDQESVLVMPQAAVGPKPPAHAGGALGGASGVPPPSSTGKRGASLRASLSASARAPVSAAASWPPPSEGAASLELVPQATTPVTNAPSVTAVTSASPPRGVPRGRRRRLTDSSSTTFEPFRRHEAPRARR